MAKLSRAGGFENDGQTVSPVHGGDRAQHDRDAVVTRKNRLWFLEVDRMDRAQPVSDKNSIHQIAGGLEESGDRRGIVFLQHSAVVAEVFDDVAYATGRADLVDHAENLHHISAALDVIVDR